jgi:hypothetical protein
MARNRGTEDTSYEKLRRGDVDESWLAKRGEMGKAREQSSSAGSRRWLLPDTAPLQSGSRSVRTA